MAASTHQPAGSISSSLLRVDHLTSRTQLVKSDFNRRVQLTALPVPAGKLQGSITTLRKLSPGFVKLATIVDGASPDQKLVLLDPHLMRNCQSVLSEAELSALTECGVRLDCLDSLESRTVDVTYENFPYSAVLSCLLPPEVPLSSFSIVGHIAHLNLTEQTLPYGELIGQVLVSKLANVKTVVNKRKEISGEFRTFELQLLAGEPQYVTVHREYGLEFELDFSQVYWNSRLSTEHGRVVNQIRSGDLVFDLCAGVGPFAVPALKRLAEVHANDLNPVAHRYLEANMRRNLKKCLHPGRIHAYNMDAREFARQVLAPRYAAAGAEVAAAGGRVYAILNLPGAAVDLLDAFVGCCTAAAADVDATGTEATSEVKIFCYSFLRRGGGGDQQQKPSHQARADAEAALRDRIQAQLAGGVSAGDIALRFVRDVATSKDMYCAEITCPPGVLLHPRGAADGSAVKRPRLDSAHCP